MQMPQGMKFSYIYSRNGGSNITAFAATSPTPTTKRKSIMKFVIVLASLAAVALARPEELLKPGIIPILQKDEVHDDVGQFALKYLSGDGTTLAEQGALKLNAKGDGHVLVKQGSVSYTSPDGTPVKLDWTADENGFRATGDHLPVAPSPAPVA